MISNQLDFKRVYKIMRNNSKRNRNSSDDDNDIGEEQLNSFRSREKLHIQERRKTRQQIFNSVRKEQNPIYQLKIKEDNYHNQRQIANNIEIVNSQKKNQNLEEQDDIDIFAQDDEEKKQKKPGQQFTHSEQQMTDESGYYNVIVGKIINNGKYKIIQKLGRGVYGVVIKAQLIASNQQEEQKIFRAIKILRKNQVTEQSGARQYNLLKKIKDAKLPSQPSYVVETYDNFYESGHLCLVVQLLGSDLRSYCHKNQCKVTLQLIKQIAICMFISLFQLRKSKIIHADIKPDNFLLVPINQKMKKKKIEFEIKLSDFGTSYEIQQHQQIQQLVARYYRAPEIVLGTDYGQDRDNLYGIDTWAIGCSLFQLYTGNFLFPASSNNDLLYLIQKTRGRFSSKILKKSQNTHQHFDQNYCFLLQSIDKHTNSKKIQKIQPTITSERELMNLLKNRMKDQKKEQQLDILKKGQHINIRQGQEVTQQQEMKKLQQFRDLLEKCLALNPKDRITPKQALQHPFLSYQMKLQ